MNMTLSMEIEDKINRLDSYARTVLNSLFIANKIHFTSDSPILPMQANDIAEMCFYQAQVMEEHYQKMVQSVLNEYKNEAEQASFESTIGVE